MDNIDRQINYECARIDALIDELEKLAIKNGTSLEEEIDKYNNEAREEWDNDD